MKFLPLLTLFFVTNIYSQFNILNNSYRVEINYSINKQDTVCNSIFLVNSLNDTFNLTDMNGNKQGVWIEPQLKLSPSTDKRKGTYEILRINKFDSLIANGSNIEIQNLYSPLNTYRIFLTDRQKKNVTYFSDLKFMHKWKSENLCSREGFFIEEYWFGYLMGHYKDNLRVGTWSFVPCYSKSCNFKIIDYFDENLYNLLNSKTDSIFFNSISFDHLTIGTYKNSKKEGFWQLYSMPSGTRSSIRYLYKNEQLQKMFDKDELILSVVEINDSLILIYSPGTENESRYLINHIELGYLDNSEENLKELFYIKID